MVSESFLLATCTSLDVYIVVSSVVILLCFKCEEMDVSRMVLFRIEDFWKEVVWLVLMMVLMREEDL